MVRCSQCHKEFDPANDKEWKASISGSILGDECTETYYYCDECGVYTKEVSWDLFSGEESASEYGPILRADGDAKVALIRSCDSPWNKKCRCAAHMSYFDDSLD
ncbi:MAG: hypothetical protein MUE65_04535 [Methanomassiliicoccales archaeon]|jgi:hypothetical protein|nr:hypothetical protein [Methanomassiliicoccales archaeon]